jgi:hypothetical protein
MFCFVSSKLLVFCRQYNYRLLSYCIVYFDTKLMSKVIMSYSIQLGYSHYNSYPVGYAILYTNWLSCDWLWLAWWQLPNGAVLFEYRLVTVLVPLASDSRILSLGTIYRYLRGKEKHFLTGLRLWCRRTFFRGHISLKNRPQRVLLRQSVQNLLQVHVLSY